MIMVLVDSKSSLGIQDKVVLQYYWTAIYLLFFHHWAIFILSISMLSYCHHLFYLCMSSQQFFNIYILWPHNHNYNCERFSLNIYFWEVAWLTRGHQWCTLPYPYYVYTLEGLGSNLILTQSYFLLLPSSLPILKQ